jgi:hypothetical protein
VEITRRIQVCRTIRGDLRKGFRHDGSNLSISPGRTQVCVCIKTDSMELCFEDSDMHKCTKYSVLGALNATNNKNRNINLSLGS